MKIAIVGILGLLVIGASLPVQADQKKADEKFCAAGASFQSDIAELNAIGPHSTVAEVRAARSRVDNDVVQMQMAASKMKTPTAKEFLEATKRLDRDINNVPDDATLQQVQAKIQSDVENARAIGRRLADEVGCPPATQE